MSLISRHQALAALLFTLATILGSGCDLSTKAWAEHALSEEPGQTMQVIDPVLDLTLSFNEGTAFSMIRDLGTARMVLGVLAFAVAIVLFIMAIRRPEDRLHALALGCVAGGAIGNAVDRVMREGVVDFIQLNYPWGGSWPLFNVADALIAIGVIGLLILAWRDSSKSRAATA